MNLRNETISHGTLRFQDLIPVFCRTVELLGHTPVAIAPLEALANPDADWWYSDDAVEVHVALFDQLNGLAPDGYYFGSHPGDGSDFGFWIEEE